MGTLCWMAKQDAPDKYISYCNNKYFKKRMLNPAFKFKNIEVAEMLHQMYANELVFTAGRNGKCWYEFRNHRWNRCESSDPIFMRIRKEFRVEVVRRIREEYNKMGEKGEPRGPGHEIIMRNFQKAFDELNDIKYVSLIVSACERFFSVDQFEKKLDQSQMLIGFEGGVFDCEVGKFRDGLPSDMISISTRVPFVKYDKKIHSADPLYRQVKDFIKTIMPSKRLRKYLWRILASCAEGMKRREVFYIFIGRGKNGKSTLMRLIRSGLGDYAGTFNASVVVGKRLASNSATSHFDGAKKQRFVAMSEVGEEEKINSPALKELSGNDQIQSRANYGDQENFTPQFTLFMLCNDLPKADAFDPALWRRIRVIEFQVRFEERPLEDDEFEVKADNQIDEKILKWNIPFMSILIHKYLKYKAEGYKIEEPIEVTKHTDEYRLQNDLLQEFFRDKMEIVSRKDDAYKIPLKIREVLLSYRGWMETERFMGNRANIQMASFENQLRKTGIKIDKDAKTVYGYKFKNSITIVKAPHDNNVTNANASESSNASESDELAV